MIKPVIQEPGKLIFGRAPKPVHLKNGMVIGDGVVYPEINFTLPTMLINENTWGSVLDQYDSMVNEVCQRAVELSVEGVVVEFEHLPPMTINPKWGAELTGYISEILKKFEQDQGLKSILRVTPVDIRENERPPKMRTGENIDRMLKSFDLCSNEGGDMLSIESTGGKEINDAALIAADMQAIVFALGVLAVRDMDFLWKKIINIAEKHRIIAAGDTACGFANTAMVLADKGMLPKVLSAVLRVASVPRTLQAHLLGATGPSKDCAYEGPFLKAMTGIPISMEGKSSACAHFSSLGNIASACCDMLSNESVPNLKLLSGNAPVMSMEQLIYDCRLLNTTLKEDDDKIHFLQKILVDSDCYHDPQAYILRPDVVVDISGHMARAKTPYNMVIDGIYRTLEILRDAVDRNDLRLDSREKSWIDMIKMQLDMIPDSEASLISKMESSHYWKNFIPGEYGL